MCIPWGTHDTKSILGILIEQAHTTIGHFGSQRTADYICWWYWWPKIGVEVEKFCRSCGICQTTKSATQKPTGLMHQLPIPTRSWGSIAMDFVRPFPQSEGLDYLWIIICQLTSMVRLVPLNTMVKASELAIIFMKEIMKLHRLPDTSWKQSCWCQQLFTPKQMVHLSAQYRWSVRYCVWWWSQIRETG